MFHIFTGEDIIDHVIISRQLHRVYKLSFRIKNGEVCEMTNDDIKSFSEEQENANPKRKTFYDMQVFLEFLVTENVSRTIEETNRFKNFTIVRMQ